MSDNFKEINGRKIPIIPPLPEDYPIVPQEANPIVAICGECGLELRQVMGYVCGHPRCPTGLGGVQC